MSYAYQEITTELYQQGSKSYTYWEITTGLRQQDSKTDQALKIDGFERWVIPEKIHTPTTEGMLESLMGGGGRGNNSGNSYGRWALNLKIPPWGLLPISSMFQLLQSISFQKLQTSYHIYFKFPSIGLP